MKDSVRKTKKITHIYPHRFLLTLCRIYFLIHLYMVIWSVDLLQDAVINSPEDVIYAIAIVVFICFSMIFSFYAFGEETWGEIIITEKSIIFFGLFLPIVKIKFEDVKYVDFRVNKEENIFYSEGIQKWGDVDAYKYLLISENPLPRKYITKIRSSRRKKLIRFRVNKKLCEALKDKLPDKLKGPIDYQLFLYWKAGKRK